MVKEMRVAVSMDDVKKYIDILRQHEWDCDQKAFDMENVVKRNSDFLDEKTIEKLSDASAREREMANTWNAIWALFTQASYHEISN